jgi:predicted RNA binding protein YcfA (HicA-like mRNA interferase family)
VRYREVERKLRALGCTPRGRSKATSHRKWDNPASGQSTTIPDWGSKDLKIGTLRSAVRKLGLDWDEFNKA